MATLADAKQNLIDRLAAHDGSQRIDEGDDSYTQVGAADLGRGYKLVVEAEIAANNAGISTGSSASSGDGGVCFI